MKVIKTLIIIFILCFLVTAVVMVILRNKPKNTEEDGNDNNYEPYLDYTASSTLKIVHMEGWVNNTMGEMEKLRFLVELHPPGLGVNEEIEPIDIEQDFYIHLTWIDKEPGTEHGQAGTNDFIHKNKTNRGSELEIFTTEIITDPNNVMVSQGLIDQDCLIFIVIDFTGLESDPRYSRVPSGGGLDPDSLGTIKVISGSSASVIIKSYRVPCLFPEDGGWIDLY